MIKGGSNSSGSGSLLNDFEIVKQLGEGSFSEVYKVKKVANGKEYAMKKIQMNSLKPQQRENAVNEIRILASIKSPYIISYKEAIFDENSNYLYIIMQYAGGNDLLNQIKHLKKRNVFFDQKVIWIYTIQMIKALQTIHDMNILHRDFKSANIFLAKDHKTIKMGDFNVSKLIAKDGMLKTQTGTPYYASPEVWKDIPYNSKSDIWSLGCVIYEMATLQPPFKAPDMDNLYQRVIKGTYEPIPSIYSYDLEILISSTLQVSAKIRLSCDQLLALPCVKQWVQIVQNQTISTLNSSVVSLQDEKKTALLYPKPELLQTIQFEKNYRGLKENLPSPNYEDTLNHDGFLQNVNSQISIKNPYPPQSKSSNASLINSPQSKAKTEETNPKSIIPSIIGGNNIKSKSLISKHQALLSPLLLSQQDSSMNVRNSPTSNGPSSPIINPAQNFQKKLNHNNNNSNNQIKSLMEVQEILQKEKNPSDQNNLNFFADKYILENQQELIQSKIKLLEGKYSSALRKVHQSLNHHPVSNRSHSIDYVGIDSSMQNETNQTPKNNIHHHYQIYRSPEYGIKLPNIQKENHHSKNISLVNVRYKGYKDSDRDYSLNNNNRSVISSKQQQHKHSVNQSQILKKDRIYTEIDDDNDSMIDMHENNKQFLYDNPYMVNFKQNQSQIGINSRSSIEIIKLARKEV